MTTLPSISPMMLREFLDELRAIREASTAQGPQGAHAIVASKPIAIKEAAERLGVTPDAAIKRLRRYGVAYRIGGRWFANPEKFNLFLTGESQ